MSIQAVRKERPMFERIGRKVLSELGLNGYEDATIASEGISVIGDYFRSYSLSKIFPYETFDVAHGLYINRSTIGFVFESNPLVGCTENIHMQFAGLFQYILPENSNIQFLLVADPYVGADIERWCAPRHKQSPLFSSLALKRQEFLSNLVLRQGKNTTMRMFRCFISVTIPMNDRLENLETPSMRRLLSKVSEVKGQVVQAFHGAQMSLKEVAPSELMVTIDDLVHPRFKAQNLFHSQLDWNPYQPIHEQIPTGSHSLAVRRDGLYVNEGEHVFRFYGVKRYPQEWYQSLMGNLIGDPFQDNLQINCSFFLHYAVHIPAQEKIKFKFMSKASHVERQARSEFSKFMPEIQKEAQEIQFVRNQLSSNHRFVQTNLTIGILSDLPNLNRNDQAIKNLFRANKWEIEETQYLHMQSLVSMLPMTWGEEAITDLHNTKKLKLTLSSESANILPIQGEWYGSSSPDMLFIGRRGQILTWSPFDNEQSNYNVSIVGQSGSGKSAFMQELLTGVLGRGARAFVIDIGRSFENTCHLHGGDFVEFKLDSGICLNPFTNIDKDDPEEVIEALLFVKGIICNMANVANEDETEKGIIEKAVQAAWQKKQTDATITDVAEILNSSKSSRERDLGTALYTYTDKGLSGRFFNGKSNITFKKQLTVIELEELKANTSLQNVILQMLTSVITNQIYFGKRQQRFIIMFDEAWDIMAGKQGRKFIEDLARRLRKYKSSLVTGTQTLADFYQSAAAQAAYQNSAWHCILSQKKDVIHAVTKDTQDSTAPSLNISPYEKELMISLKTLQGQYSEVLIRGPHGFAVGRLLIDPFSRILYSTQADEYASVKDYVSKGKSIVEAIELVAGQKFGSEMVQGIQEKVDGRPPVDDRLPVDGQSPTAMPDKTEADLDLAYQIIQLSKSLFPQSSNSFSADIVLAYQLIQNPAFKKLVSANDFSVGKVEKYLEQGKGITDAIELALQEMSEEIEMREGKEAHKSHLRKRG